MKSARFSGGMVARARTRGHSPHSAQRDASQRSSISSLSVAGGCTLRSSAFTRFRQAFRFTAQPFRPDMSRRYAAIIRVQAAPAFCDRRRATRCRSGRCVPMTYTFSSLEARASKCAMNSALFRFPSVRTIASVTCLIDESSGLGSGNSTSNTRHPTLTNSPSGRIGHAGNVTGNRAIPFRKPINTQNGGVNRPLRPPVATHGLRLRKLHREDAVLAPSGHTEGRL